MFNTAEIKELAAQKRLLVAESDLNRHALKNEFGRLRSAAGSASGLVQPGGSTMLLLAPLAGYVMSSAGKPFKGLLQKLTLAWQLFRVVKRVLSALSSPPSQVERRGPSTPPAGSQ